MGMFDWVKVPKPCPCPSCGKELGGQEWQSKDGPCLMETLSLGEVDNFYAHCPRCDLWVEYMRKRPNVSTLDDFELFPPPTTED